MLVLTRKSNQSIMIGDDVEVTVLSVVGDKVRIGIQAPQDVPVFRTEIYEEIHRQGEGARTAAGAPAGVSAASAAAPVATAPAAPAEPDERANERSDGRAEVGAAEPVEQAGSAEQ